MKETRWAKWKRAQRKHPSPPGKKGKVRRHHDGRGEHTEILTPKGHALIHKRNGTAGGRPRGS